MDQNRALIAGVAEAGELFDTGWSGTVPVMGRACPLCEGDGAGRRLRRRDLAADAARTDRLPPSDTMYAVLTKR